eukprot:12424-Heterococcus_DN1.PRE.1
MEACFSSSRLSGILGIVPDANPTTSYSNVMDLPGSNTTSTPFLLMSRIFCFKLASPTWQ